MKQQEESDRPLLVALTGGVASGKTSVSNRLAERGVPVVDTDLIARHVVAPGSQGLKELVDAFGREILDPEGALDRRKMRERVFDRPGQRQRLEAILHPLIEREARHQVAAHQNADYVILVVPLLVESGLFRDADQVVVVDVPEQVQVRRLLERDGIDLARAESILAAQASRPERLAVADEVIDNGGSLEDLLEAADELHERLQTLSRRGRSLRRP